MLGEKWLDAILPLQLLTLIMPLRMLGNIMSILLHGIGKANVAVINLSISSILMIGAFYYGMDWGIVGVCYAWVIMYPIVFIISSFRTIRTIELSYLPLVKTILKPLIAAIGMYLAVYAVRLILPADLNPALAFGILIATGALTYAAIIYSIADELRHEVIGLFKK